MSEHFAFLSEVFQKLSEVLAYLSKDFTFLSERHFKVAEPPSIFVRTRPIGVRTPNRCTIKLSEQKTEMSEAFLRASKVGILACLFSP